VANQSSGEWRQHHQKRWRDRIVSKTSAWRMEYWHGISSMAAAAISARKKIKYQ